MIESIIQFIFTLVIIDIMQDVRKHGIKVTIRDENVR
jgi:hypothetical protein